MTMTDPTPPPADSATRSEWNAYADALGLDATSYRTKGELIDAVRATLAGTPTPAAETPEQAKARSRAHRHITDETQPALSSTERRQLRQLIAAGIDAGTVDA